MINANLISEMFKDYFHTNIHQQKKAEDTKVNEDMQALHDTCTIWIDEINGILKEMESEGK